MERLPSGHVKQGLACRFRSVPSDLMSLQADSSELSQFVQVLFRYAHPGSFVSLRSFDQGDDKSAPFEISGHQIKRLAGTRSAGGWSGGLPCGQ